MTICDCSYYLAVSVMDSVFVIAIAIDPLYYSTPWLSCSVCMIVEGVQASLIRLWFIACTPLSLNITFTPLRMRTG